MLRHLDLFSGCGGFSLAAKQLGGIQTTASSGRRTGRMHSPLRTAQFVEINTDAQTVLRSNFPEVPIHADIRDYHPEPGEFDLLSMGFIPLHRYK